MRPLTPNRISFSLSRRVGQGIPEVKPYVACQVCDLDTRNRRKLAIALSQRSWRTLWTGVVSSLGPPSLELRKVFGGWSRTEVQERTTGLGVDLGGVDPARGPRPWAPAKLGGPLGSSDPKRKATLFTRVRGIRILGSSDAGSWIRSRNTPPDSPGTTLYLLEAVGII